MAPRIDREKEPIEEAAPISIPSKLRVVPDPYETLPLRLVPDPEVKPHINAVPVFDLQVAAGSFSEEQFVQPEKWVELPEPFIPKKGFFVARVIGESMNRRIPNGSWCLFKAEPAGSRQGKTVLVQLRDLQDPENGGQYTVKMYQSEKHATEDSWEHKRIILRPDSNTPGFSDLVFEGNAIEELTVRGELVAVLGQK
jgi:hypothetical protein